MTIVAGFSYPQFIKELELEHYEIEDECVELNDVEAIVLVSDSRISNSHTGIFHDVAQKMSQLSSDLMMAYSGDVYLAEEVYKSIHYRLNVKRKFYDGVEELLNIFMEIILYKKNYINKKHGYNLDADFFIVTLGDCNKPELYFLSKMNKYSPIRILGSSEVDLYACIGQDYTQQEALIQIVKRNVLGMRTVQEQLDKNSKIEISVLDFSMAIRDAFRSFVDETHLYPERWSVGGPLPAMSIESHPEEIKLLNEWILNLENNMQTTMIFNDQRNRWEYRSSEEAIDLFTNSRDRI